MTLPQFSMVVLAALSLVGCDGGQPDADSKSAPVRGLKTVVVEHPQNFSVRRYPSVLQPSDTTTLSFEIAGRLGKNNLTVGQRVKRGETLVSLDTRALSLEVGKAKASVEQARATATEARSNLKRQRKLFNDGVIAKARLDKVTAAADAGAAQLKQAEKRLDIARENLSKSALKAPYTGVINSVTAKSYATVSPGAPIATLYNPERFEVRFSVSYDIVQRLTVGKTVLVRLADNPDISIKAQISELASSADTVSSFPVTAHLNENHPALKAGMAIEASMQFAVTEQHGYALPLSALKISGEIKAAANPNAPVDVEIFVYDKATRSVKSRKIKVAGIRENQLIVTEGLKPGDRVASAGVAFLREGLKVKLIKNRK